MMMLHTLLLLIGIFFTLIEASPGGAPTAACETLTPRHGADPQTSAAPYIINVSANKIEKGGSLEVNIFSDPSGIVFKGFILQARSDPHAYNLIGQFSTNDQARTIKCMNDDDTVTHTSNQDKPALSFTWTSSEDFEGTIYFT